MTHGKRNINSNIYENSKNVKPLKRDLAVEKFFALKNISTNEFQIVTATSFDYEKTILFNIAFVCVDKGAIRMTSSESISVHISDRNDNAPLFLRKVSHSSFISNFAAI